jgi:hypothetical protein
VRGPIAGHDGTLDRRRSLGMLAGEENGPERSTSYAARGSASIEPPENTGPAAVHLLTSSKARGGPRLPRAAIPGSDAPAGEFSLARKQTATQAPVPLLRGPFSCCGPRCASAFRKL